jgi:branched-chain amino acid aminotransferase
VTPARAVSIDGELVPEDRASISIFDPAFLHGDGLFEVFRTWQGAAPTLDAHLARLARSAHELALALPDPSELVRRVAQTVAAAEPGDHRVRVIATRGGRTVVIAERLPAQPTELAVAVVDWPLPARASATHKRLAFADHLVARDLARATGADEALRLHADGTLAEGATCNVFLVRNGEVQTPPVIAILPGITRARVLGLCAELAIPSSERTITTDELQAADELFATSALRGVVSITKLDGHSRAVGPVTARLALGYVAALDPRFAAPA